MLVRRALIAFIVVGLAFAGCGRQITPDRLYSDGLSGKMLIDFRVVGQLDLTDYNYVIVLNTCGVGGEPYPNTYTTTFTNYSYAFALGASYQGGSTISPNLYQYVVGSNNQLNPRPVLLGASTTQLVIDELGNGQDFQLIFTRAQLDNPLQVAAPCPNATPQPGATGAPGNSPNWYINFFTIDTNNHVQDSLGLGCAQDTSFKFEINTAISSQNAYTRPVQGLGCLPSNTNAQIAGYEIDSYQ
jgi:hypothetical protein